MTDEPTPQEETSPRWKPISALDRRVAGVLVEKAKTTPSAYPITLNAVVTGCNQKSNRWPMMNIESADAEESLDRLREMGAVGLVQGYGRVAKYRHYLYEWLGVDKVELAVMAELLLRGPQTEGELRGRAARMEPIADLAELRPILASLKAKGLVLPLTPEGRGHVVSHALYSERELERIRTEFASGQGVADGGGNAPDEQSSEPVAARLPISHATAGAALPPRSQPADGEGTATVRKEIEELRAQVAELRGELSDLATAYHQTVDELERLRSELGS